MYYQGRVKYFYEFDSLSELANTIKTNFYTNVLYWYKDGENAFALANNQSTCEGIVEAAIIDLIKGSQIESLTLGWVEKEKWEQEIKVCLGSEQFSQSPFKLVNGKIVTQKEKQLSYYTCGCCGESFKSNAEIQDEFGQDVGYGICPSCEKYY